MASESMRSRLPSASKASCGSEANLLRMLEERRTVKSAGEATPSSKPLLGRSTSEGSLKRNLSAAPRQRVAAVLPRRPAPIVERPVVSAPIGVSVAHLISRLVEQRHASAADAMHQEQPCTTRAFAAALRRRRQDLGDEAVLGAADLAERRENSDLTGAAAAGPAATHVVHAWDADFSELVDCLSKDAGSDFDRLYSLDVFGSAHLPSSSSDSPSSASNTASAGDDPVTTVQSLVNGSKDILLVLDTQAKALERLWVLFESLLAVQGGKLRIRSANPAGFGNSKKDILQWEARIDSIDWGVADVTRKSDEKRMRAFADRVWETHGSGIERMLAQFKVLLRREVNGHLLIGAVEAGDREAVEAALERGASLIQRDADGNTLEDLASFCEHPDIEDLLFERRMGGMAHKSLSTFFEAKELAVSSDEVYADVLAPFMTETSFFDAPHAPDSGSDDDDWNLLSRAERLSNQSTASHTPGSSMGYLTPAAPTSHDR